MIYPTSKFTGNAEFDRALALRERWWKRSSHPQTYYMSFGQALLAWWSEKWLYGLWLGANNRWGKWIVRDGANVSYGPYFSRRGSLRLARDFDRFDSHRMRGRARVERVC